MTIDVIFTLVAIFLLIGLVSTVGVSAALSACLPNAVACGNSPRRAGPS